MGLNFLRNIVTTSGVCRVRLIPTGDALPKYKDLGPAEADRGRGGGASQSESTMLEKVSPEEVPAEPRGEATS